MAKTVIDSWQQLQARVSTILEELHADPALSVAAAANPLLALQELGYTVSDQARGEIEDRIRFDARTAVRLRRLRERVFKQAGHPFDLESPELLETVLFDELGIEPTGSEQQGRRRVRRRLPRTDPLPPQVGWGAKVEDPLEALRGRHPIMEPLLDYRRLESSEPRLARREVYEAIRNGNRSTPLLRARGVLRAANTENAQV